MKLQNLAVIFIIIILPISMVLTSYIQSRIDTLNLQIAYDQKLYDSTYDAVIAFQKNTVNSSTSNLTNSKLRDIEASANSFFTSAGENFGMSGYSKSTIETFVPALVYTLYDGYYIYSAYTNTLDEQAKKDLDEVAKEDRTYKDQEKLNGLKPYIYYSCRYKKEGSYDVVINYALDSYVTITGIVDENVVNWSGYLLSSAKKISDTEAVYRNFSITAENAINEKLLVLDDEDLIVGENQNCIFKTQKENGVKYYEYKGEVFTNENSKKREQPGKTIEDKNDQAIKYYAEAEELKDKIEHSPLKYLKIRDAVDENGNLLANSSDEEIKGMFASNKYLFEELNNRS